MHPNRFLASLLASWLLAIMVTAGIAAGPVQAATVGLCGTVTAYVAPTAITAGALSIGGGAFVVAAGTSLAGIVTTGANLCLDLTVNASGEITEVEVSANASTTIKICGVVSAYSRATATTVGLLSVAGRTLEVAAGAGLPASVEAGADVCLDLHLNGLGQVRDGDVTANASTEVRICGEVTALTKATAGGAGSLTIAGRRFAIAIGSDLPASVSVGDDICLTLELNGFGQIADGSVRANAGATIRMCGDVTAYEAATATALGSLAVNGRTFVLALNSSLPARLEVGADLCLALETNGFAQVSGGTAAANITTTLEVCGRVDAFAASTATGDGRIEIGAADKTIAAGATLPAAVKAGAFLRLRLTIDAFGRVAGATVLKVGVSVQDACGTSPAATNNPAPTNGVTPVVSPAPSILVGVLPTAQPGVSPPPGGPAASIPAATPAASPDPGSGASAPPGGPAASIPAAAASPNPGSGATPAVQDPLPECGDNAASNSTGGSASPKDIGPVPDTDSIGRVGTVVTTMAPPFLAFAAGGAAMAAWSLRRRRVAVAHDVAPTTGPVA